MSLYEGTVPTFNQFPKYSSNDRHIEMVLTGFLARKNLISCVQNALVTGFPRCFEANQSSQIPLNVKFCAAVVLV